jgi:hypothetical protein
MLEACFPMRRRPFSVSLIVLCLHFSVGATDCRSQSYAAIYVLPKCERLKVKIGMLQSTVTPFDAGAYLTINDLHLHHG